MPPFGFIIGIIEGLYFNLNTILLLFIISFILYCTLKKNQIRYMKVICKKNAILLLLLCSCIACTYVKIENVEYNSIIEENVSELIAIVKSDAEEKEYTHCYLAEVENLQGTRNSKVMLYIKKNKKQGIFKYGDKVLVQGEIKMPSKARNYEGFDMQFYYKTQKLFGNIYASEVEKVGECFDIGKVGYDVRTNLKNISRKYLHKENASLLLGILIGEKKEIDNTTIENFRKSSLVHILCVSGAHVTFIITWIQKGFSRFGRKRKYIFSLMSILLFLCIIGFSPSATRACIMGVIAIAGKLLFRSGDTINAISLSLLILLIYNPFLIFDIGLILSYGGTMGILLFNRDYKIECWSVSK